jgi:hypothetical protein
MGNKVAKVEATTGTEKKPLKPCCACPETKKVRDEWYIILIILWLC